MKEEKIASLEVTILIWNDYKHKLLTKKNSWMLVGLHKDQAIG